MIRVGKFNTQLITKGRRVIKSFLRSRIDVHTSYQVAPWGDDSCPVEGSDIVHSETSTDEVTIILGAINISQKAKAGEKRIYATDQNGVVVFDLYLKNDGTAEFGGIGDNLVRYIPLNTGLTSLTTSINAELVKIAAAIPGTPYVPTPVSISISGAKINEIKTKAL